MGLMGWVVILANCKYHFIRVHENLVQHPSTNLPIFTAVIFSARNVSFFSHDKFSFISQEEGEKENSKPEKVGPGAVIAQQAAEVNFTPDKDADIISPLDNDNAYNKYFFYI